MIITGVYLTGSLRIGGQYHISYHNLSQREPISPIRPGNLTANRLILCRPTAARPPVTAEVAGSSPVVPAIHSKRVVRISMKPTRVQKGAFLHPFCTSFRQLEPFSGGRPSGFDSVYASALGVVSEANTRASTAACAACFAGEIACV
jgi:hypothetical protein